MSDRILADVEAIDAKGGRTESGIRMRDDDWRSNPETGQSEWVDPDE